jgi:hypothetical protein
LDRQHHHSLSPSLNKQPTTNNNPKKPVAKVEPMNAPIEPPPSSSMKKEAKDEEIPSFGNNKDGDSTMMNPSLRQSLDAEGSDDVALPDNTEVHRDPDMETKRLVAPPNSGELPPNFSFVNRSWKIVRVLKRPFGETCSRTDLVFVEPPEQRQQRLQRLDEKRRQKEEQDQRPKQQQQQDSEKMITKQQQQQSSGMMMDSQQQQQQLQMAQNMLMAPMHHHQQMPQMPKVSDLLHSISFTYFSNLRPIFREEEEEISSKENFHPMLPWVQQQSRRS